MVLNAVFLLVNGIILYIPQFFPGGNRDSRNMSRIHGLLIGCGGTVAVLPGLSTLGIGTSVSSLCGVDKSYGLNMTLLMNMFVCAGYVVYDIMDMFTTGLSNVIFSELVLYILAGICSFGAATLSIRVIRAIASEVGLSVFAFYCWGIALFTFIINLVA